MANAGKQKQNGKGKAEKTERDEASDSSEDEFPGEEESEDSDSELGDGENIQVDLEARTPLEKDFHGIRQLLGRLFVMIHVDASELADVIIAQDDLGSTIKVSITKIFVTKCLLLDISLNFLSIKQSPCFSYLMMPSSVHLCPQCESPNQPPNKLKLKLSFYHG